MSISPALELMKLPFPLARPLVFFDLETTGLMVELDKIIELSALRIAPDGSTTEYTQRFDPGIKIPSESVAIHGITNEALKGEPAFAQKAAEVAKFFEGADLGGFAMRRLDIPMLVKEFEAAGMVFSMEGRRMVDASVIFREMERRNLTAAYKFYVGKDLVGAHGAAADNRAAVEVFLAQMERYDSLPRDVQKLHEFCTAADPSAVDLEGKLVWRDGEAFFNFGKYKCRSLAEVAKTDAGYLDWILQKGNFPKDFSDIIAKAKQGVFPKQSPIVAKRSQPGV